MKLSNNLKNIRKENNLSQEQLAEKLGVSRQAVSKWESGQSYPEMDKVLLICKLFNYNIDELMNENVKEVNETKESKININKYVDDFFNFITKTVNMLSAMSFKQRMKCFFEQIMISLFLLVVFAIIAGIGDSVLGLMFRGIKILFVIRNICEAIYIVLALAVGITILLHIFKIRYLDYYEVVKEDDVANSGIQEIVNNEKDISLENARISPEEQINNELTNNETKTLLGKNKERIVIRDPKHSISKFLTGIIKIVLWCIKFMVAWFAIPFIFTFVILSTLLALSFIFVKTGLVFFGSLLGIISAIIINYIILELCYNFIISKKTKKGRMAILFLVSLALVGMSIGFVCIGITEFNYIENSEINNEIEEVYNIEMKDNLSINSWRNIEYIETDSKEVKIVVKHSRYYNIDMINNKGNIYFHYNQDYNKSMEEIRQSIKDINNKEIKNYSNYTIYVYSSKSNLEKFKKNQKLYTNAMILE